MRVLVDAGRIWNVHRMWLEKYLRANAFHVFFKDVTKYQEINRQIFM